MKTRHNPSFNLAIVLAFLEGGEIVTTVAQMREQAKIHQPQDCLSIRGQKTCPHRGNVTPEWDHWLATTISFWHRKGFINKGTGRPQGEWELTSQGLRFIKKFCRENSLPNPKITMPADDLVPVYVTRDQAAVLANLFRQAAAGM